MPNVQTDRPCAHARVSDAALGISGISPDFQPWLDFRQAAVESALEVHLKSIESAMAPHSRLPQAVVYSVRAGGKRLRPILVLEACCVCGGRCEAAMRAALALELIHTFSLIHDDLPAMDDDDTRRGQPTNHKIFGEGLAILAGDWLVTHAFTLVATDPDVAGVVPALVTALADGTQRMIEGQGADIEGEGRPIDGDLVRFIHEHKTAALLETACRLGALCAGASGETVCALARYGRHLGLAFQIMDDLLDATGSQAKMGKRVGKDAAANKQTHPAAFGFDDSRAAAQREVEAALHKLDAFGCRADRLRDLARYVVSRDH